MFFYPITLSLSIRIFPVSRQPFFVPFRLQIRLILSIIMTHKKNKEITMEKITSFTIDHITFPEKILQEIPRLPRLISVSQIPMKNLF